MPTLLLTPATKELIERYAKKTCLGGVSRIYAGEERLARLYQDQFTGHIGEAAVCRYLTGSLNQYIEKNERVYRPGQGDEGWDLRVGDTVYDIKTSRLSHPRKMDYHLIVNRAEWKPQVVYIQALTDHRRVWILGQMPGERVSRYEKSERFKGAFAVPAPFLLPL